MTKLDFDFEQEITVGNQVIKGAQTQLKEDVEQIISGNMSGSGTMNVSEIRSIIQSYSDQRYLSKLKDDTAQGLITFLRGLQIGKSFVTGSTGGMIDVDGTTGQTFIEIDRLYVRLKAIFEELEIHKNTYV